MSLLRDTQVGDCRVVLWGDEDVGWEVRILHARHNPITHRYDNYQHAADRWDDIVRSKAILNAMIALDTGWVTR